MRLAFLTLAVLGLVLTNAARAEDKKDKEPDLLTRVKAMKGPFVMIVHLQVKKGEEKAILESVKPCIAATRKEPGCLTYEFSQDTQDPTKFVFYEKWKSAKALEEHLAAEHTKKFVDGLGKVLEGTPKFTFFTEVN